MIIQLSCSMARTAGSAASGRSPAEDHGFDPPAGKIILFDPASSESSGHPGGSAARYEPWLDAKALRMRLRETLEAFLTGGSNRTAWPTADGEFDGGGENPRTNIVESGLGRRPSEFFPEAA